MSVSNEWVEEQTEEEEVGISCLCCQCGDYYYTQPHTHTHIETDTHNIVYSYGHIQRTAKKILNIHQHILPSEENIPLSSCEWVYCGIWDIRFFGSDVTGLRILDSPMLYLMTPFYWNEARKQKLHSFVYKNESKGRNMCYSLPLSVFFFLLISFSSIFSLGLHNRN